MNGHRPHRLAISEKNSDTVPRRRQLSKNRSKDHLPVIPNRTLAAKARRNLELK